MEKKYYLTQEQVDFVAFMKAKTATSVSMRKRFDACMAKMNGNDWSKQDSKSDLMSIRKKHNPALTADFLSLFEAPDGLKFLTHDFDPNSDMDMETVVGQVEGLMSLPKFRANLPGSLWGLFNGFINGPHWLDADGEKHKTYLKSELVKRWLTQNAPFHPLTSNEYGEEIQKFRNTVRLSKPNLPKIINSLIAKKPSLKSLTINQSKLDKADFYTNVLFLTKILQTVLNDLAQRDNGKPVSISYERSSNGEYRLHSIRVSHINSEANTFDEVRKKLTSGGGALYKLAEYCCGYCDWTVEANFEGEYKRWRILDFRKLAETESIDANDVEGFTHIFTFYK